MRRGQRDKWTYDQSPQESCSTPDCDAVATVTVATGGKVTHSCTEHVRQPDHTPAQLKLLRQYGWL